MTQSLRQLVYHPDFDMFSEINEQELDKLFSETGADKELVFDREETERKVWERLEY